MPTKTKGPKSYNPADDMWSDKLTADLSRLETVGSSDEEKAVAKARALNSGDGASSLPGDDEIDAVAEAIRNGEQVKDPPNWRTNVEKRRKARETANMASRFLPGAKGSKWATGGIMGLLFGGVFGSGLFFMGPASLLVNLESIVTNHTNLGQSIYTRMGGSYFGAFLAGKDRDCSQSKIKCTFTKISDKKKADLEARGFKVETDKDMFGRNKVRRITFTEGDRTTEIKTRNQFNELKYTHFTAFAQMTRFPVMAGYLNPGAAVRHATNKFAINIGNKWRSSTSQDEEERQTQNRQSMNEHTGASDTPEENQERLRGTATSETERANEGTKNRLTSFKSAVNTAGVGQAALMGCIAYDVMRATRAGLILMWHAELLKFALPFLQIGTMLKDHDADWQTVEAMGNRLMKPVTQADIDKDEAAARGNPDYVRRFTQDMLGKNAMDSKAFAAALHGDSLKLEGTPAGLYTAWNPVNSIIGMEVMQYIEKYAPFGKDGIKAACQLATYAVIAGTRACFKGIITGLFCAAGGLFQLAVGNLFADDIIKWVTDILTEPAVKAMANANLTADLHGPGLGEAVVGAAGVLGNYMDRASGFPVAADSGQVKTALVDTYTDDTYIALKRHEAKQNQFDFTNQYSFASQFTSRFASIPWDGSIISILGNLGKVVSPMSLFEATAWADKGGLYQPIEIWRTEEKVQATIENCTDPALSEESGINVPGMGESCHTVPIILEPVKSCLQEEIDDTSEGAMTCIEKAIDHLCGEAKYTNKENEKMPYIDCNTGKPSEFDQYSAGGKEEKTYSNPFMMYMQYCGRDRKYPPGYTDKPIAGSLLDELELSSFVNPTAQLTDASSVTEFAAPIDDWYDFTNCVAGNWGGGPLGFLASVSTGANQTTFAWMAFYYTMCMSIAASEEGGVDYCWEDAKPPTSTNIIGGDWVSPADSVCTSPYGQRGGRLHAGLDLANDIGTPVVAPTRVTITHVGFEAGGYGNVIVATAEETGHVFRFGHLDSLNNRKPGDVVEKGDTIAPMGNSGASSGPHVHFEVYNPGAGANPYASSGAPTNDPVKILAEHGVTITC